MTRAPAGTGVRGGGAPAQRGRDVHHQRRPHVQAVGPAQVGQTGRCVCGWLPRHAALPHQLAHAHKRRQLGARRPHMLIIYAHTHTIVGTRTRALSPLKPPTLAPSLPPTCRDPHPHPHPHTISHPVTRPHPPRTPTPHPRQAERGRRALPPAPLPRLRRSVTVRDQAGIQLAR
jgi:hypothetical protein